MIGDGVHKTEATLCDVPYKIVGATAPGRPITGNIIVYEKSNCCKNKIERQEIEA